MLAPSAIYGCRGNLCGTRPRGPMQGQARQGRMTLLHRSTKPASTAVAARTWSSLVIAAAAAPAVPIKIQVEYRADFGQVLKVVGAGEILGDWDPKQAPAMEWQDGNIWSTTLSLPTGHHEFKLVVSAADSTSSIWEGGVNRSVTVPPPATTGGSSYIAECHWGNPETIMKPGGPEGVATYDDGDGDNDDVAASGTSGTTRTVGKMTVEVDDDDEEKEVGKMTIGKMTIENGENKESSAVSGDSEVGQMTIGKMTVDQGSQQDGTFPSTTTTTVGKMTIEGGIEVRNDLIDTGIGAEEGRSAAAAMTPETALAMASGDEDQLESPFAKAISGFLQNLGIGGSKDDDDDDDGQSQRGGTGSGGNSTASEIKPTGESTGTRPPGSTGASPFTSKFSTATAAAAAAVLLTTTSTASATALPPMALPRQFFPPTNPRSPFINLSSWGLPPPFATSSAQAAAEQGEDEDFLLASELDGGGVGDFGSPTTFEESSADSSMNSDSSAFNRATMQTTITPVLNENNKSIAKNNDATAAQTGVIGGSDSSITDSTSPSSSTSGQGEDEDSSTLQEFRERLRWLNKVTAEATQELDAKAPPPLKSALDSAVKAAKETDVKPAVDVAKRVVSDLQEGFSGLFSAAKDFDAATASAQLKERMNKELEARKEIEGAVAAANASDSVEKLVVTDSAKASSSGQ